MKHALALFLSVLALAVSGCSGMGFDSTHGTSGSNYQGNPWEDPANPYNFHTD